MTYDFSRPVRGRAVSASAPVAAGRRSSAKVLFLVMLFCAWAGLPFTLVGLPVFYGQWLASAIILARCFLFFASFPGRNRNFDIWEKTALFGMFLFVAVSAVANTFIFPQGLQGWLPAFYSLTPALLIFAVGGMNMASADILDTIVIIGVSSAVLLIADHFLIFHFLDVYLRLATTDTSLRRVVLFKSESSFALCILAARLLTARSAASRAVNLVMLIPVSVALLQLSESRLAIAATLIALMLFTLFVLKGGRRLAALCLGSVLGLLVLPFALQKYIDRITRTSKYFATDSSFTFRRLELEHFYKYYEKTHGLGFGVMSTGADKKNILSNAMNYAGYIYGTGGYGMGLADIGAFAALVQFGILGFCLFVFMTAKASFFLISAARAGRIRADAGAVGCLLLAFVISPWPTNFFTLEWTIFLGNVVWTLAATCQRECRREEANVRIEPVTGRLA